MMDMAELASANAITLEIKKDGLTQRQSGDWQLRFTVAHTDMDDRLARAAMGTRFACVLVEVNDDESPVDHRAADRDKWRALGPQNQAGIRCKEPVFWAFLTEHTFGGALVVGSEDQAVNVVREHCGVASRADFGKPGMVEERTRWFELDNMFQAWRAREHG